MEIASALCDIFPYCLSMLVHLRVRSVCICTPGVLTHLGVIAASQIVFQKPILHICPAVATNLET